MKIKLEKDLSKILISKIEKYEFDIGVLNDKPHKQAVEISLFGPREPEKFTTYAGGPVRKMTREESGLSIGQVLVENMKRLGINLLSAPFDDKSSQLIKFSNEFLKSALAEKSMKRVENLLQAIVRNPILKKEYGDNKGSTADAKGFDRHLIDTGQTFKAIKARVLRV